MILVKSFTNEYGPMILTLPCPRCGGLLRVAPLEEGQLWCAHCGYLHQEEEAGRLNAAQTVAMGPGRAGGGERQATERSAADQRRCQAGGEP